MKTHTILSSLSTSEVLRHNNDESHLRVPVRNVDISMLGHFNKLCEWFESEMQPVTTSEIQAKMIELAGDGVVYSMKEMKRKLESRCGDDIIISKTDGKSNMVCFKDASKFIITKSVEEKGNENMTETERIIKTAAKLIKTETKSETPNQANIYPSKEDMLNFQSSLPTNLELFMKELIKNERRQASIGQAMMKAVKTRSYIPPLLFGLGVELDQVLGSKWLLNELFQLGFSISYDEITGFKHSVLVHEDEDPESLLDGVYTQWVSDNVDHNICTIDGKETFHGTGVIAIGTRKATNQQKKESRQIRKIESILQSKEIISKKQFPITWYEGSNILGLSKLAFKPLIQLYFPTTFSPSLGIDILWHSSLLFGTDDKRPNWSGFMQEHSVVVNILPTVKS